jgi:hypothetical protein
MQQIEDGLRALFRNFIQRSIQIQPEKADLIKALAAETLSGTHGLIYQARILPVVGIELDCGVAQEHDLARLTKIFHGQGIAIIPGPGESLCH